MYFSPGYKSTVVEAANQAITMLRENYNKGKSRKRIIKSEMASLFNKKKKVIEWKHRFVCLANHAQQKIPTTDSEKDMLYKAGLGEKVVEFEDMNANAEDIRDLLYCVFPKLEFGGGFVFCKCTPNTRTLEPLSQVAWSSVQRLKERVGNSRTYIRPLQRSLDLSVALDLSAGVSARVKV